MPFVYCFRLTVSGNLRAGGSLQACASYRCQFVVVSKRERHAKLGCRSGIVTLDGLKVWEIIGETRRPKQNPSSSQEYCLGLPTAPMFFLVS